MPRHVVILHGWSDTSKSFQPLAGFLSARGFAVHEIWLGDYVSLDDDVRIEDVAKRLEAVVGGRLAEGTLGAPFDIVLHSTGGLVVRQWLTAYYTGGRDCPVKRVVMLAPANFGSRLAAMGKSMLGRIVKGWNNWFQTGTGMLNALELASPYQWRLAEADLFVPAGAGSAPSVYGPRGVWPFVIVGTHPYPGGPRTIVNEDGGDGTVRVAAANLNAEGLTLDFSADPDNPRSTRWARRHGEDFRFPLAVLPNRTHGSIVTPEESDVAGAADPRFDPGALILAALGCASGADYRRIGERWSDLSEATAALAADEAARRALFAGREVSEEYFHQYLQVNVHVVDDHGNDVPDFFLEFFSGERRKGREEAATFFHAEVLEHVHVNSGNGALRCLYIDRTDLLTRFYPRIRRPEDRVLAATITAAPPGKNVSYFDSRLKRGGELVIHGEEETDRWLKRNSTHFVRIVIPRQPKDGVFRLTSLADIA
ncbi:MAG: hypothetical protein HY521_11835 [Proteobacteria bacterium]|nr:hypothetical protein [Pseudomonadota bacterium]